MGGCKCECVCVIMGLSVHDRYYRQQTAAAAAGIIRVWYVDNGDIHMANLALHAHSLLCEVYTILQTQMVIVWMSLENSANYFDTLMTEIKFHIFLTTKDVPVSGA